MSRPRPQTPVFMPGCEPFAYKTASGRARWLSRDPIGENGGINLYGYVANNPVNYRDPLGLVIETPWDAANVAMGGASLIGNIAAGNVGGALLDAAGLIYDTTATAVPGLPAGAGAGLAAYRGSKLARNLANAGRPVAQGAERCHHVVAQGARAAEEAREKLRALGIDIDDAMNGVGLPKDFHQSMHTNDYYRMVNERSRNWSSPEQAQQGLQQIANELSQQAGP